MIIQTLIKQNTQLTKMTSTNGSHERKGEQEERQKDKSKMDITKNAR